MGEQARKIEKERDREMERQKRKKGKETQFLCSCDGGPS